MIWVIIIIAVLVLLNNGPLSALVFGSLAAFGAYKLAVHYDVLGLIGGVLLGILGPVLIYSIGAKLSTVTFTRYDCVYFAMIAGIIGWFVYYGLA